ncbi:MAG: hypothetical protein NZ898_11545 [Myxococcota bacterium]|nr:hypothetical protein [Myxococcota bacterium]
MDRNERKLRNEVRDLLDAIPQFLSPSLLVTTEPRHDVPQLHLLPVGMAGPNASAWVLSHVRVGRWWLDVLRLRGRDTDTVADDLIHATRHDPEGRQALLADVEAVFDWVVTRATAVWPHWSSNGGSEESPTAPHDPASSDSSRNETPD